MTDTPPPKPDLTAYTIIELEDGDIEIVRTKDGPDPTPDEVAFVARLVRLDKKIRRLVKHEGPLHPYSRDLNGAARTALEAPAHLLTGIVALDVIEEAFLQTEGPILRFRFLRGTIVLGAVVVGIALLFAIVMGLLAGFEVGNLPWGEVRAIVYVANWIAVGLGVGMVFFAFMNSLDITFENIGRFDPSGLVPWLRLALSVVLAILLCVLLKIRIVEVKISGLDLNGFEDATVRGSIVCFLIGVTVSATDGVVTRLISTTFNSVTTKRA